MMKQASLEVPRLLERMHRRFLDVLGAELTRAGVHDLNAAQAFLLLDIGDGVLSVQELINRGYYVRSNALNNIKKLTETGYFEQSRAERDRRVTRIQLTPKAQELCTRIVANQQALADKFTATDEQPEELAAAMRVLRRIERSWDDYLHDRSY